MKSRLNVSRIQRTGLDKTQPVALRKSLGLIRWDSAQVPQVALVPYQHDYNVLVRVVAQFAQPALNVFVS